MICVFCHSLRVCACQATKGFCRITSLLWWLQVFSWELESLSDSFIKHKNGAHYTPHSWELILANTEWQLTMIMVLQVLYPYHPVGSPLLCHEVGTSNIPIHLTGEETKALEGKVTKSYSQSDQTHDQQPASWTSQSLWLTTKLQETWGLSSGHL